jgi:hypothetical protein
MRPRRVDMDILTKAPSLRAGEVFSDTGSHQYAAEYLTDLRENWRALSSNHQRAISLMLISMAVFELLARGAIEKATFLGIEVSNLGIIRKAMPVIVAYFFYDAAHTHYMQRLFSRVHMKIYSLIHPDVSKANLDALLLPPFPSIRGPLTFGSYTPGLEGSRVLPVFDWVMNIAVMLGVLVFESYAYILQFAEFRATDRLLWITLVMTVFLIVTAFWILIAQKESG